MSLKYFKYINKHTFYRGTTFFFWHFFSNNHFLSLFLNFITIKGKKYIAYKTIYNSFIYINKLTKLNPILIFKKLILKSRLLINFRTLYTRYKVLTIPKFLNSKRQISETLKWMFNFFHLKKWKKNKKEIPFYKKISWLILYYSFKNNRLKKKIKSDLKLLRKKKFLFYKEASLKKFRSEGDEIEKKIQNLRFFRFKINSKKEHLFLKQKKIHRKLLLGYNDAKKKLVLKRNNIYLMSKIKFKIYWI